jgi:putative phosphoribosyl transferase
MGTLIYKNRIEAGKVLSDKLKHYKDMKNLIVLGLPRGGVIVAAEVARELNADLDVIVVRKLGLPGNEEVAMGAIASGGVEVINEDVMRWIGLPQSEIAKIRRTENNELLRREQAYRGDRPLYHVQDQIVVLVDDGIATGATMKAAVTALRQLNPKWLAVAVPVAPSDAFNAINSLADEVICPLIPVNFRSVGEWYRDFSQTTDAEVRQTLDQTWNIHRRHVA